MAINTITLNTFLVRDSNGSIDHEATLDKFQTNLLQYEVERDLEAQTIGEAVHAVFDEFKGVSLNMPALTSFALKRLNVQPETFTSLSKKVGDYIRDNAGDRDSGASFKVGKGKGGGCRRWSDTPEK